MNQSNQKDESESWNFPNSVEPMVMDHAETKKCERVAVRAYSKRDILSGRGGLANKHFGNRVYRRLIKHNKDLYRRLKSKRKQNLLIKSILLAVGSQGGRFLKEDKKSNTWFEIDPKEAWAKTSQALREPDKKSGDEESEDGQCSEPSTSTQSKRLMPEYPMPIPTKLTRQYTTDNPPNADRRIFDQLPADLDYDEEGANEEDALVQVAPALLEMSTSTFSLLACDNNYQRPQEISVPKPHRQQPNLYSNDFTLPPCFSRESTSSVARQALGLRLQSTDSYDFLKASPLVRLDTIGTFGPGNSSHAPSSESAPQPVNPPPPPLLSYTSSVFLRGLEDVLQREESTSSMDFSSFTGGIAPV